MIFDEFDYEKLCCKMQTAICFCPTWQKGKEQKWKNFKTTKIRMTFQVCIISIWWNPGGLMVRSLDCHAVDPGSIPLSATFFSWKKIRFCWQIPPKLLLNSSADSHIIRRRTLISLLKLSSYHITLEEINLWLSWLRWHSPTFPYLPPTLILISCQKRQM